MQIKKYYLVDPVTKKFVKIPDYCDTVGLNLKDMAIRFELVDKLDCAKEFKSAESAKLLILFLNDSEYRDENTSNRQLIQQKGIQAEVYSTTLELTKEV